MLREQGVVFPPVNARAMVATRARIVLFSDDTEDGMTVYRPKTGRWYVYINRRRLNGRRANFTWAHEAGHIYLGHGWMYDCNKLTDREQWILDREANMFAAELLMPWHWVEKFVPVPCGPEALEEAARLFGVSREAVIHRLEELGIQDQRTTVATMREAAAEQRRRRLERTHLHPQLVLNWALAQRELRA
ncbi:MAG TPA: ImmA/IrrE family metallo-endopeptidase [Firmicutes bacterium]|nr:ImmA/IrrE family metallo-endopeptidase [Bacillota bacterium]